MRFDGKRPNFALFEPQTLTVEASQHKTQVGVLLITEPWHDSGIGKDLSHGTIPKVSRLGGDKTIKQLSKMVTQLPDRIAVVNITPISQGLLRQ